MKISIALVSLARTVAITAVFSLAFMGCGSSPVRGTFLSGEKSIWIADPGNSEISYCESNGDGHSADPICYPVRRAGAPAKKSAEPTHSAIDETPAPASIPREKAASAGATH